MRDTFKIPEAPMNATLLHRILLGAALVSFLVFAGPSLLSLWGRWIEADSYYIHGPFALLAFIWLCFKNLRGFEFVKTNWLLACVAPTLLTVATIYFQVQHIHFGEYLGLSLIFISGVASLWGKEGTMRLRWALWFLLLALPVPNFWLVHLSFFLRQTSVFFVVNILKLTPLLIQQDGNLIQFGSHWVRVADACSGLRTLITVITMCSALAYLEVSPKKRRVYFFLAVPTAIFGNVLRILLVCLGVGMGWGKLTLGILHEPIGWFSLALIIVLIFFVMGMVQDKKRYATPAIKLERFPCFPGFYPPLYLVVLFISSLLISQHEGHRYGRDSKMSAKITYPVGGASSMGSWQGKDLPLSETDYRILASRDLRYRSFSRPGLNQELYYFEMNSPLNQSATHPPEISLVSEGYETESSETVTLHGTQGDWSAHRTVYHGKNNGLLIYHWYSVNEFRTDGYLYQQLWSFFELMTGHPFHASMRRISFTLPQGEEAKGASALMSKLDREANEFARVIIQ